MGIGSILGSIAGPILQGIGGRNERRTNERNYEKDRQHDRERNERNRQHEREVNERNRKHQDKINAENRAEAERIRIINQGREDSQIQRQIADGRLAGLSPLASMGNAGYTPGISSLNQSSPESSSPETNQVASHRPTSQSGASLAGDAIQNLLQNQGIEAQILEARSRTLLNEANARQIDNEIQQLPTHSSDGRRIENSTILVRNNAGELIEMPNNELLEGLTRQELANWNALMGISSVMGPRKQKPGSNIIKESTLPARVKSNFKRLELKAKARQQRLKQKLGR